MAALLLALLAAGCTAPPGREGATGEFVTAQKAEARRLERGGDLAAALTLWRSLLPLGRGDTETREAIDALEKTIANRVRDNLARGERAYAGGNNRQGDLYMLRVLALEPGQDEAIALLRKSTAARASAQQKTKSDLENRRVQQTEPPAPVNLGKQLAALESRGDYGGMVALVQNVDPSELPAVGSALRRAHIALADRAQAAGKDAEALAHMQAAMAAQAVADDPLVNRSTALRGELSTHWYREGSRLLNNDLDAAIAALEKSLQYNPYNDKARRKLAQAETLQRNLSRIEKGS